MIQKKTKIICTIGPKSETKERLTEIFKDNSYYKEKI